VSVKVVAVLVPLVFLGILAWGLWTAVGPRPPVPVVAGQAERILAQAAATPPTRPGEMPPPGWWIHGADCDGDPAIQVWAYDDDTYLLRQSKCDTYEAPVMYLLFGEERALLMDTGSYGPSPVFETVDRLVTEWLARNDQESLDLLVGHTHHHGDHIASDHQFRDVDYLERLAAPTPEGQRGFWGFRDYPYDAPMIDLGGRVLYVLGTPGHHPDSVTLYDRGSQILFTNDIVYPGHLFVFSAAAWYDFVTSMGRLVEFAATHPVQWLVGCHIEMADTPGAPYAYTTQLQPDEHDLQLAPTVLVDVLQAGVDMGDDPSCTVFDEFVIHPVYLCGIRWNG
jgi:hydroxyacylglutathione hydrolase